MRGAAFCRIEGVGGGWYRPLKVFSSTIEGLLTGPSERSAMFYPGCPLCQGALAAALAVLIGPAGAAAARRDPLVVGLLFVWTPLAGFQAMGRYYGGLTLVRWLHLNQVFIPWWIHVVFALVLVVRVIRAWRQGRIDSSVAAAKAAAEDK